MSQEIEDPLHIGNTISILSDAHGYVVGRVIYRNTNLVRVMSQEASDRAIDFPMTEDGSAFAPELGVSVVEIIETHASDYYVDVLGARPGETLEFFTVDGTEAAPTGIVEEVIKSKSKDSIKLTDGRILKFRGVGPEDPIAVIRVLTDAIEQSVAAAADTGADDEGAVATAAAAVARQSDMLALLRGVLPSATMEVVPTAERSFPDSMQREDMFQDLLTEVTAKQRTNPRRIRLLEREVDLAIALKNKSLMRDEAGRVTGTAPYLITNLQDAINASTAALPAAIPIVSAARVLNLDKSEAIAYKETDVLPRVLDVVDTETDELAERYLEGALPDAIGRGFYAYTNDLLGRDQATLQGSTPSEWLEDQDIVRTAGLGINVQGLSSGLPRPSTKEFPTPPVTIAYLISDVTDRSMRVLTADRRVNHKTGEVYISAPTDPSKVSSYVMLPPKAALALRPPRRTGDLPTALLYSAALEADELPTIAETLRDLYAPDASPQNAWTLSADSTEGTDVADWLQSVLRYVVHPIDSLGPRSPRLLSLLDTLGLSSMDLSQLVANIVWAWTKKSQSIWRSLLVSRRKEIQKALDTEEPRTFQTVTGDSALWPALRSADSLKELLEDIKRRNPMIADAPTLLTASLLTEAQGDAMPLVWAEIAKLDTRTPEGMMDPTAAAAALATSRAYILKRKALRDAHLLGLRGAPEISTCPHATRLEAVRNVSDVLQRSRLLRDFIEEFQGPREGDWMTCTLCKAPCVCYHELMELEALAQPARMDAIQKQILVKYGGERYEGKIVCRNCGQGLQDIDYDEHVEFDDQGRAVVSASVLTDEQMEEPTETAWKKATADLAPPPVVFATQTQRDLGDALQVMIERGGLQMSSDVVRQIVRYADLYVSARAPPAEAYEKQRTRMLTAASTKIKTATGLAGTAVQVPTYAGLIDQIRVSALIALTAIAIQTAEPAVVVNNPFPLCEFSRVGYPFDPSAKPEETGALLYMACVVASIQRDAAPWRSLTWSGETKLEARRKKALGVALPALQIILGADSKAAPLSFTPEVRSALSKAQTDVVAIKAKALVSITDQIPVGFRPEPFPPALERPAVERNPVPAIEKTLAEGKSTADMMIPVADAMHQQAIAVVVELHRAAFSGVEMMIAAGQKPGNDAVCCPVAFSAATTLQGEPEQMQLLKARAILRGTQPTVPNAGTHLWPTFEAPVPAVIDQVVEESVFFKLFLKFCYVGPQPGESHEFSTGNMCRQCGLRLGKPLDTIDFGKDGAGILAAQEGDLRIEITQTAFNALSEAIRRRRLLTQPRPATQTAWRAGLDAIAAQLHEQKANHEGDTLLGLMDATMTTLAGKEQEPMDEITRETFWTPMTAHMDQLRAEVEESIGPLIATGPGREARARAQESMTAMTMFDTLTEDPFIEGPRAVQEYWCAKAQSAGADYTITKVTGAVWGKLSQKHTEMINKLVYYNSIWYGGEITAGMRPVLRALGGWIGPLMTRWLRWIRPTESDVWTVKEARMILRSIVLQGWRDAVTPSSWMYAEMPSYEERTATAAAVANWTRGLMLHVKQQFMRYSKETIKRILQDRAGLERDTIVEEFQSIKDDDIRAAELMKKQFRIGRWAGGANLQKYDADTFEFESEQRKRMGIVDPPVDPILLAGQAAPAPANDYGFGALAAEPEDGYDMDQGAAGDDY